MIALRQSKDSVFISWRMLGTDPGDIAFNLYRASNNKSVKLNDRPLTKSTCFVDTKASFAQANTYTVRTVVNGKEGEQQSIYFTCQSPGP